MVTIKDIANITGVSPTTVANVIHGRTNKVSKENVERDWHGRFSGTESGSRR